MDSHRKSGATPMRYGWSRSRRRWSSDSSASSVTPRSVRRTPSVLRTVLVELEAARKSLRMPSAVTRVLAVRLRARR